MPLDMYALCYVSLYACAIISCKQNVSTDTQHVYQAKSHMGDLKKIGFYILLQLLGRLKMQDWKMTDESARLENDGLENDLFLRHTMRWKTITPIFDDGFKLVTPISSPFLPTFKILQRTICRICVVFETA